MTGTTSLSGYRKKMICKNNDCVPDFDSVPLPTEITYYVYGYLKKCRLEVSPSLQLLPADILSEAHILPAGLTFPLRGAPWDCPVG